MKRIIVVATILALVLWIGSLIIGTIQLHQAEHNFYQNSYQPLEAK